MNLDDFKQKIFTERPDVKKKYDALEQDYAEKSQKIKAEIAHDGANPSDN